MSVAMARAAHQVVDRPVVFDDPLALRIAGADEEPARQLDPRWRAHTPETCRLRAFLAARSRYAEDALHAAVARGARQYAVLGAGLDTFAYRNPYPADRLHVFEVDHPATQGWKRERLADAQIAVPPTVTFAPVDLEKEVLATALRRAGFENARCTFFSWLGGTPYVTSGAVASTLRFVASMPAGSGVVFDYAVPPSSLDPAARAALDELARRVARAGEPFRTFFEPSALADLLRDMGFGEIEDLDAEALNARYFRGRADALKVIGAAHVVTAQTSCAAADRGEGGRRRGARPCIPYP